MPKISAAARDERRQRFIQAAWRCAARKGYRDTTVDDVCAETGLSKGAFYGYFDSKQALLLGMLDEDAATSEQFFDQLEGADASAVARLRRIARRMLERGEDAAQVQVRADLWTAMVTEPEVRERLTASTRRQRERLRNWIEDGIAAGELEEIPANAFASLLLALSDGLLLHGGLDPSAFKWANMRKAVDILLSGVART